MNTRFSYARAYPLGALLCRRLTLALLEFAGETRSSTSYPNFNLKRKFAELELLQLRTLAKLELPAVCHFCKIFTKSELRSGFCALLKGKSDRLSNPKLLRLRNLCTNSSLLELPRARTRATLEFTFEAKLPERSSGNPRRGHFCTQNVPEPQSSFLLSRKVSFLRLSTNKKRSCKF